MLPHALLGPQAPK